MITAFLRTVILYVLITAGMRAMGKRQIGELEPGELVLTMMISDLASVPMQDLGIPLFVGIIPILTLLSFSLLLSTLSLKNLRFRELLCGTPAVLVANGVIQQGTMARNRYTLDELMEELRGQGYSSLNEVKYAVLENSGHLSILPWSQPPVRTDIGIEDSVTLPRIIVNDGRVLSRNLRQCGRNERWLTETLKARGIHTPADVFLMTVDEEGAVVCVAKETGPLSA